VDSGGAQAEELEGVEHLQNKQGEQIPRYLEKKCLKNMFYTGSFSLPHLYEGQCRRL